MEYDFKFYAFLFIGVYLAVMVITGLWCRRRENEQDFIIGNRSVGVIPTAASLAASFRDGGGIAFWIAAGFAAGYAGMWLLLGVTVSALLMAIIGPRLRDESGKSGIITIQERVRDYVGKRSAQLTSVISMIFGILIISLQYHVSGSIFAEILGVPKFVGVLVVGLILIAYMVTGGYKSIVVTDTIQFFIMFSLVMIPFLIKPAAADFNNVGTLFDSSWSDGIALFLFGLYYLIMTPESWQRIMSAKDKKTIRLGIPLTAFILILMTLSLIWLGMGLKQIYPDIDKATVYTTMFRDTGAIAPWLLGYILLVFLSITMSTQSAACYSFVSTLGKIFLPGKTEKNKDYIAFTRRGIVLALTLAGVLSLTVSKAVEYMFDIMGFVTCLSPIYIFAAVCPRLKGYKSMSKKAKTRVDKVMSGSVLAGVLVFFVFVSTGMTQQGFIYTVTPGVGATLLAALSATWAMKKG